MSHEIKRGRPKKGSDRPSKVKIVKRDKTPEELEELKQSAAEKLEAGVRPNNVELSVYNRDRVKEFIGKYVADNFAIPPISAVERELGVNYRTAEKYMHELLNDNQVLKNLAKNANAKVMSKHLALIMDNDKVTPAYIREWYERFFDDEEKNTAQKDNSRIVINIVTAKPKEVHVEEANVIQD